MSEIILQVRNLSVAYGAIRAIQEISIEVQRGETVAIVGANGAGKTTLMKAISGLLAPRSGEILTFGRSIKGVAAHELARAGMLHIPEGRGTLRSLTVIDNLRIAYDIRPAQRSFEEALTDAYASFPRLKERSDQIASNMSGGEQQMLALARAIVNPPTILLVDEPSLGLSPLFVTEVFRILRSFQARGITILIVEQNARRALRLAERGYILRQGTVVMSGPAKELIADEQLISSYLGTRAS